MPSQPPAIELIDVCAGYGETVVLESVKLNVCRGECVAVIGRNGVGKTTLLSTIVGRARLISGRVQMDGTDISRFPSHRRALAGLGLVPQEREIFPSLSIRENLQVAARPGKWTFKSVCALFPRLAERLSHRGNQLSGGEQQMLAVGRALIGNPSIILLDEPTEGLAPVIVDLLMRTIRKIAEQEEVTLVLVEQNAKLALAVSTRAVVMSGGSIVYDGASAPLLADQQLLNQYVGVAAHS
jgi:branched-chain amino acid transport system ATP-binding protein